MKVFLATKNKGKIKDFEKGGLMKKYITRNLKN